MFRSNFSFKVTKNKEQRFLYFHQGLNVQLKIQFLPFLISTTQVLKKQNQKDHLNRRTHF